MILIILLMLTCTQITECPQNQMRRGHGGHNTDDHDLGGTLYLIIALDLTLKVEKKI